MNNVLTIRNTDDLMDRFMKLIGNKSSLDIQVAVGGKLVPINRVDCIETCNGDEIIILDCEE